MRRASMDGTALLVVMLLVTTGIAIAEFVVAEGRGGALLLSLALWTAFAQGSVAVAAAGELTGARWVGQVREELLAAARVLPFLALLFLLLWPQLDLYAWAAAPTAWLNRTFFLGRNLGALAVTSAVALGFAARARRREASARRWAVGYLAAYAVSQTLVAFDWIMSLAWPWVSSMLGLYFTVEAFYAGLALAGLLLLTLRRGRGGEGWDAAGRDAGLLLFGWSVLWGGLFFAQFLLLWYGNLPEEVSYIAARLATPARRGLVAAFIALCWAFPFFLLIPERTKRSSWAVGIASASVLLGLAAERVLLVLPELPLRSGLVWVENLLLVGVWMGAVAMARSQGGSEANMRGEA
jgi:hypothetical protein